MASRFRVTGGHFETSPPNDPEITLNTKRSNVSHIHVTATPDSQISVSFALRPAVSEHQAILRQVRRMTPPPPFDLEH